MNDFLLMMLSIVVVWFVVLYAYWIAIPAFGRWLMRRVADDERGETK